MDRFKNVEVVKKANVYYDGKVSSRTVYFEDGSRKTLGFMLAGTYEFRTGAGELMEILAGSMKVTGKDVPEKVYQAGESFSVPENSSFQAVVDEYADYCCSYAE